ncbi:hypothetical protein [Saccharopolyspora phatthalungensis]|uniref:Cell shape-determining protein MreC n=1 Tax=Saccharopolyspora phatthalungensis TaxID=664693 RepID=A0A840QHQ0_9PSEU|nr:hypothetical protein [Saccharopolyspora phatthalungensis]MBB5158085.1 cell shape-determining protein MreC [Saccharopolyspora phatthalungensis]
MNRKTVIAIVALLVVVCGSLLVRDPVGAASAVRSGWDLLIAALTTVVTSLTTFFQHLFASS